MKERERLIELLEESKSCICVNEEELADYLLENGVTIKCLELLNEDEREKNDL